MSDPFITFAGASSGAGDDTGGGLLFDKEPDDYDEGHAHSFSRPPYPPLPASLMLASPASAAGSAAAATTGEGLALEAAAATGGSAVYDDPFADITADTMHASKFTPYSPYDATAGAGSPYGDGNDNGDDTAVLAPSRSGPSAPRINASSHNSITNNSSSSNAGNASTSPRSFRATPIARFLRYWAIAPPAGAMVAKARRQVRAFAVEAKRALLVPVEVLFFMSSFCLR